MAVETTAYSEQTDVQRDITAESQRAAMGKLFQRHGI